MRHEEVEDARRETQKLADLLAAEQQTLLSAAEQLLSSLAQLPDVRRRNASTIGPILARIHSLNSWYSNLFIADRNGTVWVQALDTRSFSIRDRRYYINAMASERFSSGEYVMSRATGKAALNFAYPFKDQSGRIAGTVNVGIKIAYFESILDRSKMASGTSYLLIDHRGTILGSSQNPEQYSGKACDPALFRMLQTGQDIGTYQGPGIAGDRRIITYRKLRLPGEQAPYLYIHASIPLDSVMTKANKALAVNMALFIPFLALAVFLAWIIGKRSISDRIRLLEDASRRLAGGNLEVRVGNLVTEGELGSLGRSFDDMAQQLLLRQQALVESERNYREIFNTTKDAMFVHDADSGSIIEINKTAEELYGYSREEILRRTVQDISAGESPYSMREALAWIRKTSEEGTQHFEWLARRKNGELFWTEVVLSKTQIGGAGRVLAVVRDITERKWVQQALEQDATEWSAAMDASEDIIYLLDTKRRVMRANRAFFAIAGGTPETVIGRHIAELLHPQGESIPCPVCRAQEDLSDLVLTMEADHPDNPAGRPIEITVKIVRNVQAQPISILMILRDLTHEREIQEEKVLLEGQLYQAQKMESIGQLAAGIAHDFNNILAAIMGYGTIMQMKMRSDDPSREYLDQILASSERAASLTQSLLAFSRKQVISPRNIDLNESIRKVEKFLTRTIGEDIMLTTALSTEALTIYADITQIEQVLMNLAANARDAMPKGGRFTIETGRVALDDENVRTKGYGMPGPYARMIVSDTGEGMDEQTQNKVFEPFFTTKELGRGTGLGLAIVYGIVKQNNGAINVYSEPGRGTTFKIYLPLISAGAGEELRPEVQQALRGGTETILLAEDNETVRQLNKELLQEFGYTVIEAVDGEEALQKYREHRDRISLLVLDVIMPKKNGREVFEEVMRGDQKVKVIFTSGYSADLIQKQGVLEKGLHFFSKPSSPYALLRMIREVLDLEA